MTGTSSATGATAGDPPVQAGDPTGQLALAAIEERLRVMAGENAAVLVRLDAAEKRLDEMGRRLAGLALA